MITRKSAREIERMRAAGRIVAEVLALVESELKPGVTTGHLDRLAERFDLGRFTRFDDGLLRTIRRV